MGFDFKMLEDLLFGNSMIDDWIPLSVFISVYCVHSVYVPVSLYYLCVPLCVLFVSLPPVLNVNCTHSLYNPVRQPLLSCSAKKWPCTSTRSAYCTQSMLVPVSQPPFGWANQHLAEPTTSTPQCPHSMLVPVSQPLFSWANHQYSILSSFYASPCEPTTMKLFVHEPTISSPAYLTHSVQVFVSNPLFSCSSMSQP
jgi:hypothetical protein